MTAPRCPKCAGAVPEPCARCGETQRIRRIADTCHIGHLCVVGTRGVWMGVSHETETGVLRAWHAMNINTQLNQGAPNSIIQYGDDSADAKREVGE